MVDTVLVDIDGTLIDNNALHVTAWLRAFKRVGQVVDGCAVLNRIGMGGDKLAPDLLPEDSDRAERARGYHGEEYSDKGLIDHAEVLPGARELLSTLRGRGVKVILASSAKPEEADRYLDMLDARNLLDAVVTSADVEGTKPDPDIFAVALERAGGASSAVVIGDTIYDVEAASKLGLPCIAVLSGGIERGLLENAGAAAIYTDAADVLEHLEDVLGISDPQAVLESR